MASVKRTIHDKPYTVDLDPQSHSPRSGADGLNVVHHLINQTLCQNY